MASKLMQLIETRTKRPVLDESDLKVSSHWKLIKSTLKQKHGDDPKKLDEKQPLNVGHGIHPVRSLLSEEDINFVALNSFNNNFVGIDIEGKATVFLTTGHREAVDTNILKEPICGLVYAKKPRFYVAWGLDENIRVSNAMYGKLCGVNMISNKKLQIRKNSKPHIIILCHGAVYSIYVEISVIMCSSSKYPSPPTEGFCFAPSPPKKFQFSLSSLRNEDWTQESGRNRA